ncbi:MAG: dihydroorotase [bacterium]
MSLAELVKPAGKMLFKNAQIVDPDKLTQTPGDVLIEDGKLQQIGKVTSGQFKGEIVDVEGCVLCPGLIDMHVHFREPGREDEETVESGTEAAMMGGFTSVCTMPNTEPPVDNAEVVEFLKKRSKDLLVDVYPIAAVTKGRLGMELTEMGELMATGAVAFSDDGDPVATAGMMRRALEYASMFDAPIIDHCEDKSLSENGCMHEGEISTRLGLPGIPGISEEIIVARDIQIAEFTRGRLHLAHISTAGSVELIRHAKARGVNVTCEVMTHHFALDHRVVLNYDSNTKMNPPLRSPKDVQALLAGLKDGTIDVIATDHAPHSIEEKETEFEAAPFGITGLETALGLVLTQLVEPGILALPQAIAKMTRNPAEILRLERGKFKVGAPASITVFDPNHEWTVDKKRMLSKSKNTPFEGWKLKGKVFGLYNNGLWWRND